ncbi:hypothetical protein DSUL_130008 [Desulfovibrionales bacterium]
MIRTENSRLCYLKNVDSLLDFPITTLIFIPHAGFKGIKMPLQVSILSSRLQVIKSYVKDQIYAGRPRNRLLSQADINI